MTEVMEQLVPLKDKIEVLKGFQQTRSIYNELSERLATADTILSAKHLCSHINNMCHPKAWGDLYVEDFGDSWADWFKYLGELSAVATECGNQISSNYSS